MNISDDISDALRQAALPSEVTGAGPDTMLMPFRQFRSMLISMRPTDGALAILCYMNSDARLDDIQEARLAVRASKRNGT